MSKNTISVFLKSPIFFTIFLTSLFFIICLIAMLNHGMWLDELQAWSITRDNSSFIDIFKAIKYEGHPGLWYILLYPLTRLTHDPIAMQFLHLLIATANIYIFTKFSPFSKLQKALFAFGYFPLYRYGMTSRNYAIGILLIFILSAAFSKRHERYVFLSFLLALLCHANFLGLIIAITFGMALFGESLFTKKWQENKKQALAGLSILIIGIATSVLQLIPPPDFTGIKGWKLYIDMQYAKHVFDVSVGNAYLPYIKSFISNPSITFNISLALFSIFCLMLIQAPAALFIYLVSTTGFLSFFYVKYIGQIYHHGYIFIMLISCLWIAKNRIEKPAFLFKYQNWIVTPLLVYHLIFGVSEFVWNKTNPESACRETAGFIKKNTMQNMPLIGDDCVSVPPISGYLDRLIYYPAIDKYRSYVVWNFKKQFCQPDELIEKTREFALKQNEDVLLISNRRLAYYPDYMEEIKVFKNARTPDERYYLYYVRVNRIIDE